jgi:hypothetical protein
LHVKVFVLGDPLDLACASVLVEATAEMRLIDALAGSFG